MSFDSTKSEPSPPSAADPELEALPAPRRPGRRLTLATMAVTAVASLAMAWTLVGEATYATRTGRPVDVHSLGATQLKPELANRWARGEAVLDQERAVRYRRPLDAEEYRLFPVVGRADIWVELQVPEPYATATAHFIPPPSFVGRLVPLADAGLRHAGLEEDIAQAADLPIPPHGAWLLIDGESPSTLRWALGLIAVFVGFAGFNCWGLVRLLKPVPAKG